MRRTVLFVGIVALCLVTRGAAQSEKLQGVTYRSPTGTTLRLMLDESNVGPEVTLGEIVFPPNSDSMDHKHGATEMFYVVSGELDHIVNGKSQILKTQGFVKLVRRQDGPVVGIHLVGDRVGELVGEAQLIYNWEGHAEDVAPLVHAHPTQNEALGEAHMALAGKPLHAHS